MKRVLTLLLAAGLTLSAATCAQAIDFKAQGQWLMGVSAGEGSLVNKINGYGQSAKQKNDDTFSAAQRIRLKLNAVANENLSGTVYFELGDQTWGQSASGAAVGADGKIVEVKNAYLDWAIPDTTVKVRMGIQAVALPNAAGGSAVLDDDIAGVTVSGQFNENVGLTFSWLRPYNDNYTANTTRNHSNDKTNYLDNIDLFALSLPLTFDGIELTPWIMYGIIGQNAYRASENNAGYMTSGYQNGIGTLDDIVNVRGDKLYPGQWASTTDFNRTSKTTTSAFWAGLPIKLSLWDPLNIEFDFNYGYVESQGRGWTARTQDILDGGRTVKRYDTRREGWLAKALIEYKMDWGTPGLLGWYASGDDDNPKNGSERMPSVSPCGNFTSFLGDGNYGWASSGNIYDRNLSYAGTWGIGLQLKDMSFLEDLTHTFRVALWGGTNSPTMAKYTYASWGWSSDVETGNGASELYLTTNDYLLEFNLVNEYKLYENFKINFELGYIANMVDSDTWKKANRNTSTDKQDAWKAQLIFAYEF